MSQKTLKALGVACLIVAATGVFILMLKNPKDNFLNIPIFLCIMATLAFSGLNPRK
jgi:hypothetical protein